MARISVIEEARRPRCMDQRVAECRGPTLDDGLRSKALNRFAILYEKRSPLPAQAGRGGG